MLACEHGALLIKKVCHFMVCLQHNMHVQQSVFNICWIKLDLDPALSS